jgi:hypothetical protein
MRESRTYGSVRGAGSNLRPYRDRPWALQEVVTIWGVDRSRCQHGREGRR